MRRIGPLELLAITSALTAKCEAESQYSRMAKSVAPRNDPQPEYKHKKCKSCFNAPFPGRSYCSFSCDYVNPKSQACKEYRKKTK